MITVACSDRGSLQGRKKVKSAEWRRRKKEGPLLVLFSAPLCSPNSHNSGSFLFAFLHGEIALISVAYLSGSCKLLPCLLETAPQHRPPAPVSHLVLGSQS